MRGGKVAKSYLDPLAVRIECIRAGKEGRGWKRFLVFAELTKSRKGADYVALFAYYSFEAWLRIVFAEGPRVVINGITLYAYANANIVPTGSHAAPKGVSPFEQFWKNFAVLAEDDRLQLAIIIGMLWTCLIWIISALSLAMSVILYMLFLWHHIPSDAGGLSGYCRTKINRRMERIVKQKTDKSRKKENEIRARQEAQAFRQGLGDVKRQPTLPDLGGGSTPSFPSLSRQSTMTTMTTLPEYTSRPGTAAPSEKGIPPMPSMTPVDPNPRPGPTRHMTAASDASWASYNSNAPLMNSAGDMGHSPADRVQTPASAVSTPWSARPGPGRNFTDFPVHSDRSYTPGPPRPGTSQSHRGPGGNYQMEPIHRPGTGMSQRSRPVRMSSDSDTLPQPPIRGMTPASAYPQSATSMHAPMLPDPQRARTPTANYNPYFPPVSPIFEHEGRESAASGTRTPIGGPPRSMTAGHAPPLPRLQISTPAPPSGGYIAFNPNADNQQTSSPFTTGPETYKSYSRPNVDRVESPASTMSATSYQRSFSRPFSGQLGPNHGNLQPPRQKIPDRGGSFDDILDHY